MIPGIPAVYLYLGVAAVSFSAGLYSMHTWHTAQRVEAIEQARKDERSLQKGANQASVRYADALDAQKADAALNEKKWRAALNAKDRALDDCRVDSALVELLDQAGMPGTAGDPGESRPRAAGAEAPPDASCIAELSTCRENYADVCRPNALQLRELQEFTRGLIRDYNRAIGR